MQTLDDRLETCGTTGRDKREMKVAVALPLGRPFFQKLPRPLAVISDR
jgi:hypothetical protein